MTVPVDIQYYKAIVDAQDEAAKIAARHEAHGNKVQTYAAGKLARVYVTLKRYKPKAKVFHEVNANGRDVYMYEKAHAIYLEATKELAAGHDLHTGQIANVVGCSQGYVTKVLQFLMRFCFIVITAVIRGRYGRLVGRLATRFNKSFLHPRRGVSVYGGMINQAAINRAQFEAYAATLKDGDLYVPLSQRA